MKWLEVRRHSLTKKDGSRGRGSALSQAGVELAQQVGTSLVAVRRVVVSREPRTLETALAMGYAVDEIVEMPTGYVPGEVDHHEQWRWEQPYVRYAELLRRRGEIARVGQDQIELWARMLSAIADGESALVIGHGGTIEPGLVAALPDADHASWGSPLHHCEGARLAYDGGFRSIDWRRVDASGHEM